MSRRSTTLGIDFRLSYGMDLEKCDHTLPARQLGDYAERQTRGIPNEASIMSMPSPSADRNLIFGLLALQMDFVTREQLLDAMHAWMLEKQAPLGDVLCRRGVLADNDRAALDALVERHVARHGNAQASLAALHVEPDVREQLGRLEDPDLQASLASLGPTPATKHDSRADSVGIPVTTVPAESAPAGIRYRRLREHARGGLGEVFVAVDEELNREVALKEIQDRFADRSDARARFLREAEVTGKLEHPGIVPIYGMGTYPDGRPYYAMRFVRGESMQDAITRFHAPQAQGLQPLGFHSLGFRELLGRFVMVCNAVAYAHSRGVIHRDLKPANAMLGEYGETLVVDWGLARMTGQSTGEETTAERPLYLGSGSATTPTEMGQVVGTPAYMPPEQAEGRLDCVGVASDVFALGGMLYCLLTGQAPYSGSEVVVQARRGDVVPARKRKVSVPAELEAVCQKAMAKRPEERYATASALAADMQRWLADEPVTAWPEPLTVKAGRWVRKNRVLTAAAAAAVLVALVLGTAAGVYRQQQRERAREQARSGLAQVARLREAYRYTDALAMLEQVRGWAGQAEDGALDTALDQALAELTLARDLDRVRQEAAMLVEGKWDPGRVRTEYPRVLARHGLHLLDDDLETLTESIRGLAVRHDVVAALDDWARVEIDVRVGRRLLQIANRIDKPDSWRNAVREAVAGGNRKAMLQLVGETPGEKFSASVVHLLADTLGQQNVEATALLRRMQRKHSNDFWTNFNLGHRFSKQEKHSEAAECFLVAVALRPETAVTHYNMGVDLKEAGKVNDAIEHYREAIRLEPKFARAYHNLGFALSARGKSDEAIEYYRRAIEIDPNIALPYNNIGIVLTERENVDEAIAYFQKAIDIDPTYAAGHSNLGDALRIKGKLEEAVACHRRAIKLDSEVAAIHNNLGTALHAMGRVDDAIASYRVAIRLDPKDAKAHYNLGNSLRAKRKLDDAMVCFKQAIALNPRHALSHNNLGVVMRDKGKTGDAKKCYQRAIEINPRCAPAHDNLGIALMESGKPEEAIACFKRAIELDPNQASSHNNLGEALRTRGKVDEAIASFQRAIAIDLRRAQTHVNLGLAMIDKGKPGEAGACFERALAIDANHAGAYSGLGLALTQGGQIVEAQKALRRGLGLLPHDHRARGHVLDLVRHCRQLLDADDMLKAFLAGKGAPADAARQVRMADLAQQPYRRLFHTAILLYRDAFSREPSLADAHRYNAACAAALAGSGQGKDGAGLDEQQRATWRKQSLDWLAADLAKYTAQAQKATGRPVVRQQLAHWLEDPDLAGVRDERALAKLSGKQRDAWHKLWADVAALLEKVEPKRNAPPIDRR
jgi:tetratricopeptide (TPR) repeat protein/tRNA A-37 threonylcarbamoyl transferase component Bud32